MAKRYRTHTPEFKKGVLDLVAAKEKSVNFIAKDMNLSPSLIYAWIKQATGPAAKPAAAKPKRKHSRKEPTALALAKELAPTAVAKWKKAQPPKGTPLFVERPLSVAVISDSLDITHSELEPLQRVVTLARQVCMTTSELVDIMLRLTMERAFQSLRVPS